MKAKLLINKKNVCEIDTDNKKNPITFNSKFKGLQNLTFEKEGNKTECYFKNLQDPSPMKHLVCTFDSTNTNRPIEFSEMFPAFNNYVIERKNQKGEVENGAIK